MSLVLLLLLPLFIVLDGWVLSLLWSWFVVPLGVVPIGVWQGSGLSILVGALVSRIPADPRPPAKRVIGYMVGVPLFSLLSGFLLHRLMEP